VREHFSNPSGSELQRRRLMPPTRYLDLQSEPVSRGPRRANSGRRDGREGYRYALRDRLRFTVASSVISPSKVECQSGMIGEH
jgi:hypothetical protein